MEFGTLHSCVSPSLLKHHTVIGIIAPIKSPLESPFSHKSHTTPQFTPHPSQELTRLSLYHYLRQKSSQNLAKDVTNHTRKDVTSMKRKGGSQP